MNTNAKKHHYISACYLKNFASPQKREGKMFALDKHTLKQFPTNPDDAACENYFNTITGENPNLLEDELAKLESEFSIMLETIKKTKCLPEIGSNEYVLLITFITLFAIRNPSWRQKIENADKQRYKMLGKYDVKFPQGYHIEMELALLEPISKILAIRNWELLIYEGEEDFITSNNPISLVPSSPKLQGQPLGFGLRETAVIFPLTTKLCMVGTFEPASTYRHVTLPELAEINLFAAKSKQSRFIYSVSSDFIFLKNPIPFETCGKEHFIEQSK